MRSAAVARVERASKSKPKAPAAAAKVVNIESRFATKRSKYVQLFLEDMIARPRKPLKATSNAADIRRLAVMAIRTSRQGSLTFHEIRNCIKGSLDFDIKWEYFQHAILSDMQDSRLAILGGRVFVL
jgi:hypothetical protein